MSTGIDGEVLADAILKETEARDVYKSLSERIGNSKAKGRMLSLSDDEEHHRQLLTDRYENRYGRAFDGAVEHSVSPTFDYIRKSTFKHTDAIEVIRLAIGAETDAAAFYSRAFEKAADPADKKLFRYLIRFEKGHKRKLEKELRRMANDPGIV